MDCLEASVPPHRRPPQRGHHPPSPPSPAAGHRGGPGTHAGLYGSGVVVAHVASRHTSAQAWATEPPQQQQQQQPQTSSTTSSAAAHASPVVGAEEPADACDSRHPDLCGSPEDSAAAAAAALPPPPPPPAPSTQQQRQLAKYLSLSTCGSSASNLTALGHSTTATASITTAATDSSQQSTPLSGASCHHQQQRQQQQQQQQRQQRQRVCVQRTADEEGLPRSHSGSSPHPSPDSRSGSHARDEEGDDNNNSSTAAAAAAVAAAACARDHRQAHQQHSPDGDLAGSPALASAQQCTSFANKRPRQQPQHSALHHDCGSARMHIPNLSTFADTASPSRHAASKSSSDHAYSAVGGAINTHVFDQVAYEEDEESQQQQQQQQQDSCQDAVRGHGGAQGMALGGGALAAAAVATAGAGLEATPVEPPPKRFAAGEVEVEVAALEKLHHVSTATARAPARTDDEDDSDSREKTSPANSRRHAAQQQQQQQRETRSRKSRQSSSAVGSSSSSSSAVLGGRRIPSDSVTARIPYDPASLATPSSQLAGGGGLAPARGASPPRCATPPPPPSAPIALTELRYATLALSFMMRMLCALHEGEPIPSSDFHSHCVPPMSVAMYVERLSRYCACSGEALLCALVLLHAYVTHSGHPVTIFNAHRLLITSVVLGIKLRDDVYYSNIYYARIGGISAREMNKLERLFLEKLDWVTQVQEDEYVALMDLLAKLRIDTPPTAAELEAFALAHPDAVAAYVPTDADAEGGEVATSSDVPLTPEQQARLTVLRGAYHRHQWSTLAVPWMEQQERRVRAKKTADDAAAAAAQEEEGRRWRQYNKEDEEAALRRLQQQQRPASASAWLSPQSVQKTSSASTAAAGATTTAASAWAGEPRYSSEWPAHPQQKSSHHGSGSSGGGAAAAAASLPPPAPSSSAASRDVGGAHEPLRYTNFLHFANAAASSYTAASATTAATAADADLARASSQSRVRFHTAATVATAAPERPPRAVSAATTLGIASTTAEHSFISASSFVSDTDVRHGAAMQQQQQQQQQSLVAGTAEPSPSSNVPGSGINVNAQPYYYVSSRTRKQQQQQQQQTSSCAASPASVDAPVNRPASATAEGESSARSPSSSSFTSPACLNTIDRRTQNTERSADTSIALSRGIREVVSAMTRVGVFGGGGSADAVDVRQTSGPATTASASSYHVRAFPQRPIAKAGVEGGGGSGSDPATSACMPRWSPPSAQQQQQQRRPTFAGQHALGKKRSKPDSYKDY
ncbi:CYC2-like cyclin [Novymonas esmeraldas]|uniref:CYC2-like cyclin n=1 Tax=Novymonas esmeraldas TaxID=1808958 RepID=A0AAW0ESZ8_9TRYP